MLFIGSLDEFLCEKYSVHQFSRQRFLQSQKYLPKICIHFHRTFAAAIFFVAKKRTREIDPGSITSRQRLLTDNCCRSVDLLGVTGSMYDCNNCNNGLPPTPLRSDVHALEHEQGGQIVRTFDRWVIVYFEYFFENYRSSANSWTTFFPMYQFRFYFDKKWVGRRGIVVIASAYRTEEPGFESH
jgi:hypothetical protein